MRLHRATTLLVAMCVAAMAGCAGERTILTGGPTVGQLKTSLSHIEFENEQLKKSVAKLERENRSMEDRLVQEQIHNGDLAARLDDARTCCAIAESTLTSGSDRAAKLTMLVVPRPMAPNQGPGRSANPLASVGSLHLHRFPGRSMLSLPALQRTRGSPSSLGRVNAERRRAALARASMTTSTITRLTRARSSGFPSPIPRPVRHLWCASHLGAFSDTRAYTHLVRRERSARDNVLVAQRGFWFARRRRACIRPMQGASAGGRIGV